MPRSSGYSPSLALPPLSQTHRPPSQDFLSSIINVAICRIRHAATEHQDLALTPSHPEVIRGQRRGRLRLHMAAMGEMIRRSRPRKAGMPNVFWYRSNKVVQILVCSFARQPFLRWSLPFLTGVKMRPHMVPTAFLIDTFFSWLHSCKGQGGESC